MDTKDLLSKKRRVLLDDGRGIVEVLINPTSYNLTNDLKYLKVDSLSLGWEGGWYETSHIARICIYTLDYYLEDYILDYYLGD